MLPAALSIVMNMFEEGAERNKALGIWGALGAAGANAPGLLVGGSFFGFLFVGTLYMQQVLHYSALKTGIVWLATSLSSVALAGVSQLLVTRGGAKVVMAFGMTLIGGGVIWATQMPVHGHFLANLGGPLVIVGAGTAFAFIHTKTLLHAGHAGSTALTGGFHAAFSVLGAIGLIAVPAIFARVRRDELTDAVAKTTVRDPQPTLAGAN